jgi:hypothetical protein
MSSPATRSCLFLLIPLFLLYYPCSAQESNVLLTDSTDLFSYVQREYGPDQVLINGLYPEDYIMDALGHPFFQDTIFHPGYVILHNQKFDNIYLEYNIFDQNIIVSQPGNENNSFQIIPPNQFISEFKINSKIFRKLCFDGVNEHFFQVVYDGKIKCLYAYSKNRYISYHMQKYSSFKFTNEIRRSYLLIDQKLYEYNTIGSFLKYFPETVKSGIKTFCKKEKLRLSKSSDQEIARLIEFCEAEIRKN